MIDSMNNIIIYIVTYNNFSLDKSSYFNLFYNTYTSSSILLNLWVAVFIQNQLLDFSFKLTKYNNNTHLYI